MYIGEKEVTGCIRADVTCEIDALPVVVLEVISTNVEYDAETAEIMQWKDLNGKDGEKKKGGKKT